MKAILPILAILSCPLWAQHGSHASSSSTLSSISCSAPASGQTICTLTFTSKSGGIRTATLKSSSSAVKVPATCSVYTDDQHDPCNPATVSAVTSPTTVTITATYGGVSKTFLLQLGGSTPTASLSDSASSVAFGNVNLNTPATKLVTLTSTGTAPVVISTVAASSGFTVSGGVGTLAPGASSTLTIGFDPSIAGAAAGSVAVISNVPSLVIALSGTGVSVAPVITPTTVVCGEASITGAGSTSCTVSLSSAPTASLSVPVTSSSPSVTVSPVTVAAGATSGTFTATAAAVTAQTVVNLMAALNGSDASTTITLLPASTTAYQVNLTWDPPVSSPDAVAGYIVLRATGSGVYAPLFTTPQTTLTYSDKTVAAGTYLFEVVSVDASGLESVPSNVYTAVIP